MSSLFAQSGIAAAVAREIRNVDIDGRREGLAYKAEWDRRGSNAQKHVAAAEADSKVPARVPVNGPR